MTRFTAICRQFNTSERMNRMSKRKTAAKTETKTEAKTSAPEAPAKKLSLLSAAA